MSDQAGVEIISREHIVVIDSGDNETIVLQAYSEPPVVTEGDPIELIDGGNF